VSPAGTPTGNVSLSVDGGTATSQELDGSECASFTATGVINDITHPFSSTTVDGAAKMIVNMVDAGKQSGDVISFQINAASSKGGGLWYSSDWTGTRTMEWPGWRQPIGSIARDVRAVLRNQKQRAVSDW
jgi:hypothetical protein